MAKLSDGIGMGEGFVGEAEHYMKTVNPKDVPALVRIWMEHNGIEGLKKKLDSINTTGESNRNLLAEVDRLRLQLDRERSIVDALLALKK